MVVGGELQRDQPADAGTGDRAAVKSRLPAQGTIVIEPAMDITPSWFPNA
jgi:hypothetical protein